MTVLVSKESLSSPNTVKIIEISFSWCLVRCFVCNVLIDLRLGNIDSGLKVCNVLAENIKINLYSPLKKKKIYLAIWKAEQHRERKRQKALFFPPGSLNCSRSKAGVRSPAQVQGPKQSGHLRLPSWVHYQECWVGNVAAQTHTGMLMWDVSVNSSNPTHWATELTPALCSLKCLYH